MPTDKTRDSIAQLTWEHVDQHGPVYGAVSRARVAGGWLYRHSLWLDDDKESRIAVSIAFVPDES